MTRTTLTLLCLSAIGCALPNPRDRAVADAIRRLESRIVAVEIKEGDPAKKLPPSPVTMRAASLRAAAEHLEKAELARVKGELGRAQMLFQQAVDEVGADELADVEAMFIRHPKTAAVEERAPAPEPAQVVPVSLAAQPADPVAKPLPPPPHPRERLGGLSGSIRLDGPFADEGGQGVVTLTPIGASRPAPRPRHATVEQRKKDFVPRLLVVPTGSTVSFPNADPVFHNVFSLSEAKRFDLGLYKNGDSRDVTFNQHGVVRVLCNLHAAMNAYVFVHDEPYATVTDRGGRFHFRDLPPGKYKLRAWHERTKEVLERLIEIDAGGSHVVLPMRADLQPMYGPDKEGKPRGPNSRI
jgi:plastocyanin